MSASPAVKQAAREARMAHFCAPAIDDWRCGCGARFELQWHHQDHQDEAVAAAAEAATRDELTEAGRLLGDEQCCPDACDGGACERCPGCSAGWCVNGHDFLSSDWEQMSDEERECWWSVAREHNVGLDAALRRAEAAEAALVDAGRAALEAAAEAVRERVPYGVELLPDGREDPAMAAVVEAHHEVWAWLEKRAGEVRD